MLHYGQLTSTERWMVAHVGIGMINAFNMTGDAWIHIWRQGTIRSGN
jgi:hypothetical protein